MSIFGKFPFWPAGGNKRKSAEAKEPVSAEQEETERVQSVEEAFEPFHGMWNRIRDAYYALEDDSFYAEHAEEDIFNHFYSLVDTYRAMHGNIAGSPKEILTERYLQMKSYIEDLEHHAQAIVKALGVDPNMDGTMLKLTHPKIHMYLEELHSFSFAGQHFVHAYEAAYPAEKGST